MCDLVRADEADVIIERATLKAFRLLLNTLADYLECTTDAEREHVMAVALAELDKLKTATVAETAGLEGRITFEQRRAALVAQIRLAELAAKKGAEPIEVVDGQVVIKFTPQDAKVFRRWQAEQLAKRGEVEDENRQPWEQDPDAWKGDE